MFDKYKRSEILANRQKWIDFLMLPDTKKGINRLSYGYGERCCLGHACYALGINEIMDSEGFKFLENLNILPTLIQRELGLKYQDGMSDIIYNDYNYESLAKLNDFSSITPQEIGKILLNLINGDSNSSNPFYPLSNYSE